MSWSKAASARATQTGRQFNSNLRQVAESFASHDQVSVAPIHVDKAFQALAHHGLTRARWLDRPETETAFGSFFIGFAFACPDLISAFFEDKNRAISQTALGIFFVLGVMMVAHAAYKSRLPSPPASKSDRLKWVRRVLLVMAIVISIGVVLGTLLVRGLGMQDPCGEGANETTVDGIDAFPPSGP